MDMSRIKSLWPHTVRDKSAMVALWDHATSDYSKKPAPTRESSAVLSLIDHANLLPAGGTVLDIGCGNGRFSLVLSRSCKHVTGTDISPKMLDTARDAGITNADFVHADWDDVDLDALGWRGSFNLALANMTPAVDTPDALEKMCAASRGWCLLVRPTHRTDSVTDKIIAHLGIASAGRSSVDTMALSFALLWEKGYLPHIEYEQREWDMSKTLDDAKNSYLSRIKIHHRITDDDEQKIDDYLESIAQDGLVKEHVQTTIVMLYWQV